MPALPSWLTEPLCDQFVALLPRRPELDPGHPLGCHRRRIGDRIVFDKLLLVLRFGCSYEAIADSACSATTIRNRRDQWIRLRLFAWIRLGLFARPKEIALDAYDRIVGRVLDQIAVDGAIAKAPGGGEAAGRSPADRGKQGMKRSGMTDGYCLPLGRVLAVPTATTRRSWPQLSICWTNSVLCPTRSPSTSMPATTPPGHAGCLTSEVCTAGSHTREPRHRSRPPAGGTSSARTPGRKPSTGSPAATNAAPASSKPFSTSPTRSSPYVA